MGHGRVASDSNFRHLSGARQKSSTDDVPAESKRNGRVVAEELGSEGKMTRGTVRRRSVIFAIIAILSVTVTVAAVWGVREYRARATLRADCAAVERLGASWEQLSDSSLTGSDKPEDWRALGADIHASASQVSDPAKRSQMDKWADGLDMMADVTEARAGPYDVAIEEQRTQKSLEAGTLTYQAAGSLYEMCGIHPKNQ